MFVLRFFAGPIVHRISPLGLLALCASRNVAVIADEVFADFAFEEDARRFGSFAAASDALCFALGGLSKSCALPQLKLGWIAVSGPEPLRMEALSRLEFITDTYLSVSTPVQLALPHILGRKAELQGPVVARLRRNLESLRRAASAHPELSVAKIEGGWSALVQCPATRSDEERAMLALEHGVVLHPGHFFDIASGCYLVASLLCETEVFDAALPRFMSAAVR